MTTAKSTRQGLWFNGKCGCSLAHLFGNMRICSCSVRLNFERAPFGLHPGSLLSKFTSHSVHLLFRLSKAKQKDGLFSRVLLSGSDVFPQRSVLVKSGCRVSAQSSGSRVCSSINTKKPSAANKDIFSSCDQSPPSHSQDYHHIYGDLGLTLKIYWHDQGQPLLKYFQQLSLSVEWW